MDRREDGQDIVIRASELGQYAFCARAWWLGQVLGYRSTNLAAMRQGDVEHEAHGSQVVRYQRLQRLGFLLILLAAATLIAAAILIRGG
jgi:hypothetical protein